MCNFIWVLWGERNNRVFKGMDRDPREILPLACFHALRGLRFERPFVIILL